MRAKTGDRTMGSRLEEQRKRMGKPIPANPLPVPEGDSSDTEIVDDNDTPPGVDPKAVKSGE